MAIRVISCHFSASLLHLCRCDLLDSTEGPRSRGGWRPNCSLSLSLLVAGASGQAWAIDYEEPIQGLGGFDAATGAGSLAAIAPTGGTEPGQVPSMVGSVLVDPLFGTSGPSIAVRVPPGRKGMTPDLSVNYASGGGDTQFGKGWDISLPSIQRNAAFGPPFDYENFSSDYADERGFVLNLHGSAVDLDTYLGSDLSDPDCERWAASTEVQWIHACFDRSSNSWTVRDRNGSEHVFGAATTNARTGRSTGVAEGTFGWFFTSSSDPNGNRIAYSYDHTNGHAYPSQIDWGGNSVAGILPMFHARFVREARPDLKRSYRGGFADVIAERVVSISVWADTANGGSATNPLYNHRFSYSEAADTGCSQLTSAALETATGQELIKSARFTYSQGAARLLHSLPYLGSDWQSPAGAAGTDGHGGQYTGWIDINGDGLLDRVQIEDVGAGGVQLWENQTGIQGSSAFALFPPPWVAPPDPPGGIDQGPFYAPRFLGYPFLLSGSRSATTDFDGDSLPDYLRIFGPEGPGECEVDIITEPSSCEMQVFFNRNGEIESDYQIIPGWPEEQNYLRVDWFDEDSSDLLDLTGDGKPDVVRCPKFGTGDECQIFINSGSSLISDEDWKWTVDGGGFEHWEAHDSHGNQSVFRRLIDMNGDGLPDILSSGSNGQSWEIRFHNGFGWEQATPWNVPPGVSFVGRSVYTSAWAHVRIHSALRDMNGDGLPDYVDAGTGENTAWNVYLNTGSGFTGPIPWEGTEDLPHMGQIFQASILSDVMDLNGDGLGDWYQQPTNPALTPITRLGTGLKPGLLIGVENGLGATTSISYSEGHQKRTPDYTAVANGLEACSECSRTPFPVWAVDRVTVTSGLNFSGHTLVTQYDFIAPYFDPLKRVFRGFWQSVIKAIGAPAGEAVATTIRQYAPAPYTASDSLQLPESTWPGDVASRPFQLVYEKSSNA